MTLGDLVIELAWLRRQPPAVRRAYVAGLTRFADLEAPCWWWRRVDQLAGPISAVPRDAA